MLLRISTLYTKEPKILKKGIDGLEEFHNALVNKCKELAPETITEKDFLPQLLKIRSDFVSKIFDGKITLNDYSIEDLKILLCYLLF